MTFAHAGITCEKCSSRWFRQTRSVTLVYQLPDGAEVKSWRVSGWCGHCKDICDIEATFDAGKMRADLEALQSKTRSKSFIISNAFSRLFGSQSTELYEQITVLKRKLWVAETHICGPRCLVCGSTDTQPLDFDVDGLSIGFIHDCGGRLKLEPTDPDAPRFSYHPETIYLDVEGRRTTT